jgi:putative MATE family efflux protein
MGATLELVIAGRKLTTGPIPGHIAALALPMLISTSLQSVYALVDLKFVEALGPAAVAGLSISLQAFFLILAVSQVIAATCIARVSQRWGAGQYDDARAAFTGFVLLGCLVGAAAGLLAFVTAEHYVATFTADPEVHALAVDYFRVNALTFLLQVVLIVIGTGFRASGDFTSPVKIMTTSVLINLALDPLLIFGWGPVPALGLTGAAWATVVAQGVANLTYLRLLMRERDEASIGLAKPLLSAEIWRELLTRGLPAGTQFFLLSAVLGIVLAAMKPHGPLWTATAGGGFRVLQQTILPLVAVAFAASAIAGQNLGARQPERVRGAARTALLWGVVYALVLGAALFFFGRVPARLFASQPEELALAATYFRWSAPITLAFAMTVVPTQVLQGLGRVWPSLGAATIKLCALALLVFVVIPGADLPPEYVFGANTAAGLIEGLIDVVALTVIVRGLTAPGGRARAAVVSAVLALGLLTAAPARADGFNDWLAEQNDPLELSVVPQLIMQANPEAGSDTYLQVQAGVAEGLDLVMWANAWVGGGVGPWGQPTFLPRIELTDGLLVAPGVALQGEAFGAPLSLLPSVFYRWRSADERWVVSHNDYVYVPVGAASDTSVYSVTVLERKMGGEGAWGLYLELDADLPLSTLGDDTDLDVLVGLHWDISDWDMLNVAVGVHTLPAALAETMLGLWYSRTISWAP